MMPDRIRRTPTVPTPEANVVVDDWVEGRPERRRARRVDGVVVARGGLRNNCGAEREQHRAE